MSENPFEDLNDSHRNRRHREARLRRQRRVAFRASLGATVLVAAATGAGGAAGGWIAAGNPDHALGRFVDGLAGGLAGGILLFLTTVWQVMRQAVVGDAMGSEEETDLGSSLFWSAIFGAVLGGIAATSTGLDGSGEAEPGVLWGAAIGAAVALVAAYLLWGVTRRTTRAEIDTTPKRPGD